MKEFAGFTLVVAMSWIAVAECRAQGVEPRDYILPSWGDTALNYGAGVDPALDSPEALAMCRSRWNHIQIELEAATRRYKIVLQPVGTMPAILASGTMPTARSPDAENVVIRTDNLDDVYQLEHDHDISLVNFCCIENVCLGAE
jgi:hypothetical protein